MIHKYFQGLCLALLCMACTSQAQQEGQSASSTEKETLEQALQAPAFNADSCYEFVAAQVAFGERVPNTDAHLACGDYLVAKLRSYGAQVTEQKAELTAFDGTILYARNIIASWQPTSKNRVMLCAHWDSRPFCDEDPHIENQRQPVMGANDGASGVAVLLELARLFQERQPNVGVDIVLFDAEDYGISEVDHSFCLGSQYWAKQAKQQNYQARFGILLDMVGGKNPYFAKDQISVYFAADYVDKVWKKAANLGYGSVFVDEMGGSLVDDHYYVNLIAGIPCLDIIHFTPGAGFPDHWHTVNDQLSVIDPATLQMVGEVVTAVLYEL